MTTEYLQKGFDWKDPYLIHVYDEMPLWSAMFGMLLLEHVPMRAGMRVLDLGCGTGFPLFELAQRLGPSCRVFGLDPWQTAVSRSAVKRRLWGVDNAHLVMGDAGRMPFDQECFDLVVSNIGINNFADPAGSLRECFRVMRPAAHIVLTTNLQGHMREFYEVYSQTLLEMGRLDCAEALERHVRHRTTVERASGLLVAAGFRVCMVRQTSIPMRFLDGSALLRHSFVRLAFLPDWRKVIPEVEQAAVFARLEENLNRLARQQGQLEFSIPAAYIEAQKETRGCFA